MTILKLISSIIISIAWVIYIFMLTFFNITPLSFIENLIVFPFILSVSVGGFIGNIIPIYNSILISVFGLAIPFIIIIGFPYFILSILQKKKIIPPIGMRIIFYILIGLVFIYTVAYISAYF